ncbi:hypothetical protein ALC53_11779 [Atta colombica]|uniref:Uncharacterized protein n=1 Tax=Atta colombica TaxID=520822 RepID=A0A195AZW4_9HYME|nr:hypothetical protein ALC53_11779 [Atta colombica]
MNVFLAPDGKSVRGKKTYAVAAMISLSELRRLEVERGKIDTYTKQLDVKRLVAPDGALAAQRKTETCRGRRVLQQPIADFFFHFGSSRTTEGVEREREGFLLG